MTFEKIDRPNKTRTSIDPKLIEAIIATKDDESAVKVTLDEGVVFVNWHQNLRNQLMRKGYRLHHKYHSTERQVTCWIDPNETAIVPASRQ